MISNTNIPLLALFKEAYRKYCIPRSEQGIPPRVKENITQHQFDKDACGVFVMDRIEQRAIHRKDWEETQQQFGLTQNRVLDKRNEFANVFSRTSIGVSKDGDEVDCEFPSEDKIFL